MLFLEIGLHTFYEFVDLLDIDLAVLADRMHRFVFISLRLEQGYNNGGSVAFLFQKMTGNYRKSAVSNS